MNFKYVPVPFNQTAKTALKIAIIFKSRSLDIIYILNFKKYTLYLLVSSDNIPLLVNQFIIPLPSTVRCLYLWRDLRWNFYGPCVWSVF